MSLKIEPLVKIEDLEKSSVQKKSQESLIEQNITTEEVQYKFLQKSGSSKLKKCCSLRTCNTSEFQCRQILLEQRSLINNQFWIEMNPDERLTYIIGNSKYSPAKPDADSYSYTLLITGQQYSVCKKMFLSTLSLVEKNVKQVIDNNYQKHKNSEISKKNSKVLNKRKDNSENKKSTPVKKKISRKSQKNSVDDVLKIEYVEINPECNLDGSNSENDEQTNKKPIKKKVKKIGNNFQVNKKTKKRKMYQTRMSSSEQESEENSDTSWNENVKKSSSADSESDSDMSDLKISDLKSTKRSPRLLKQNTINIINTTNTIKKPKVEPLSDVENVISSSEDEHFSNVEDTDESDVEECNKNQKELIQNEEIGEYSDGTVIPRKFGPTCLSTLCSKLSNRKCQSITENHREYIFDEFWNKMTLDERKFYVKQNVELLEQKGRSKNISPLIFYLSIFNNKLQVCQNMFSATLALNKAVIYNWIYDYKPNDIRNILDPLDTPKTLKARKRFENYAEKLQLLEDFLDSLDKMPPKSFAQQKVHKIYLTEKIEGLRNLQKLYKEAMKSARIANPLPVKILKKVFCAKHYTFYTGYKKRQAKFKTIDDTEITPELEESMKRDQQERQRDKILTKKPGSNIFVLDVDTCDGKVSPNWNGDGDEAEPNSRLGCFNFTVSNVITLHTYNYWFCEVDALDTTPSSFITCLMDYLVNYCTNAKHIIIYSRIGDLRFKNIDMTNALLDYSITNKITITQKFYIPRKHLYKDETECQSVYRSLYRKLRRFEIHLPSDYITATIDCKREPTEAKWFNFNQFRDYSFKSKKHRYINLLDNNEDIDKIKSIICKQDGTVSIKMDFDDDWELLANSLKCKISQLQQIEWPQLSYDRRKISAVKYQFLQSLKLKLPRDCHFFYDYLTIEI